MVASFHETQSKCKKRGGYLIIYGCYNGRLRGAQGPLSAQRALRGALCTSAPKIGAHSTSLAACDTSYSFCQARPNHAPKNSGRAGRDTPKTRQIARTMRAI